MRGRRVPRSLAGLVAVVALGAGPVACGEDDAEEEAAVTPVAECTELRDRENALIDVANDVLEDVGESDDPVERAQILVAGFDELVEAAATQVDAITSEVPELAEALRAGAERAIEELQEERDRFAAAVSQVSEDDERGRVGEFQNALEKAFSEFEPPRAVYVDAGLGDEIDADPACEFVTQRKDPAG